MPPTSARRPVVLLAAAAVLAISSVPLAALLDPTDRILRRDLGEQLLTLAVTTALMIDGDQHAALRTPDQMDAPTYRAIKALLIKLRRANAERHVRYLYTMRRSDKPGFYRFVVDSDEGEAGAKLGDEYDARALPELLNAYDGPVAEKDFARDKWGTSLSAYAPIYDSAGLPVAIVGADAEAAGFEGMRQGVVSRVALSLVGLALAFAAGLYGGRVLATRSAPIAPTSDTPRDGVRLTVTVLFCDVRGFTRLSERMRPEQVLRLLNEYFTRMIDIVFAHDGTLDKFVGDGILCLFGAPRVHPDDPERAVRTAVAMQQEFARINALREASGERELRIGIGLHTGPVVAGAIGSERRLAYSVIGDTVGVASRVQGEAAGGEVLITQATWEMVKDVAECLELDPRHVREAEAPLRLFQVLGLRVASDRTSRNRLHLPVRTALPVRCYAGSERAEAGRVVDLREDGLTLLSRDRSLLAPLSVNVEGGEAALSLTAEWVSMDELDPVDQSVRYVHQLRFVGLADADRERLARSLWRGAVAPPA